MKHVLCYARSLNDPQPWVVMLRKRQFHLPGSPVGEDETLADAAYRTLYEQTGILADKSLIAQAGLIYIGFDTIEVMDCSFRGFYHTEACSEFQPFIGTLDQLLKSRTLAAGMRAVLPLCYAGCRGWTIQARPDSFTVRM